MSKAPPARSTSRRKARSNGAPGAKPHPRPRRGGAARSAGRPASARAFRVLIADAQLIDRFGMATLLGSRKEFEVVAEVGSIAEAIAQYRLHAPDVLILALGLRGADDGAPVHAVRGALPGARILAVSERGVANCLVLNPPGSELRNAGRCELATDCLQLAAVQGAQGTIRRNADPEDLFAAVRAVASGQVWYEQSTASALAAGPMRPGASPASVGLSARELDVAELLAAGRSNKEIAARLSITEPTVKKHIGRVLLKLGVADRLQAALFVARHPLILRRETSR